MPNDVLDLISDILILVAGSGAILFALSYASFFNWTKTDAGRSLMQFVLAIVALFLLNALGRWLGNDYPFRVPFRLIVYIALVYTMWHLVWVLWKNWRSGSERPLELEAKPRKKENPHVPR